MSRGMQSLETRKHTKTGVPGRETLGAKGMSGFRLSNGVHAFLVRYQLEHVSAKCAPVVTVFRRCEPGVYNN
jgi:hypothetical protein